MIYIGRIIFQFFFSEMDLKQKQESSFSKTAQKSVTHTESQVAWGGWDKISSKQNIVAVFSIVSICFLHLFLQEGVAGLMPKQFGIQSCPSPGIKSQIYRTI